MRADVLLNPQVGDTYDYDGNIFEFDGEHWVDDSDGDTFWVSEETPPPCDVSWCLVYYWYQPSANTIRKYDPIALTWDLVINY